MKKKILPAGSWFATTVLSVLILCSWPANPLQAQETQMRTYCNPLNLDYTYMIYNADKNISYRSGADPAVVKFKGEYYMFVTRSLGYWHSPDLLNWDFITPEKWYFQGSNAPAAHNYKDSVLYAAGDPSGSMSILYTDNPKKGDWKAVPSILNDLQDPDLFIDDDGKAYMFWGSSNVFPIRGKKLDRNHRFSAGDSTYKLFGLDMQKHGWERFGENHADTVSGGYLEGAWLTRYNNKYYMQYAAPGTEFNVYADGVYMSDSVMGPYRYAPNNPVFYKPGGYSNGAGHGSTVIGPGGSYWHFASAAVNVNVGWERRICMYPAWFDRDGLMYSSTSFGDYPHFAPSEAGKGGQFTGWMLLSYNKPVKASSALPGFPAAAVTDESVKSFWVAARNDDKQWLQIDLQQPGKVYAVQVNYHDYKSDLYCRLPGPFHQYTIEGSVDGQHWTLLADRSQGFKDVPNDYIELGVPQTVRYIRYNNIRVPMTTLSISDLRVFGVGQGKLLLSAKNVSVARRTDRRDARISWDAQPNTQGYNIRWGIAPDKLYSSWLVYGQTSLLLKALTTDQSYYFSVEAFNENGVAAGSKLIRVE